MQQLLNTYRTLWGKEEDLYQIFSPYRVCPLGAHVDHQHGLVSGFAFDSGVDMLFSLTTNGAVEVASLSFDGLTTFNVQRDIESKQKNWGDYLRGAAWAMKHDLTLKNGIKGVIKGSIPIGGLSSSAALLVGFVMALAKVNEIELSQMQMIQYASKAEREYIGLRNGILDQACVVLCEKDRLLYLDTKTADYQSLAFNNGKSEVPFELGIFFSGVTRQLIGTDYNLRVSECKTAAWILEAYEDIPLKELEDTFLRNIPEEIFAKHKDKMPARFARRAQHFYSECKRVENGVKAWQAGNIEAFGKLVFESCESSINNYECGSPELIAIYKIMKQTDGIYGGRFSGAGFKGACIALVDPAKKDAIREFITIEYLKKFPQYRDTFEVFFCQLSDGAKFV